MVASKKPKQSDIELVNQKLKAAGVRLRVVVLNYKLYLRGTLPPRPGSTDNQPKQTYLALGLDATPYGYKMSQSKALEIWAALGQNRFSWNDYIDTTDWETVGAWIDRYKKHWLKIKGDTPENHRKWHRQEWLCGLRWLPSKQDLTAELLEATVQLKPPDTRARQRIVQILTQFAKFANVQVDLTLYQGNYKPKSRDVPSDEEIAAMRATIKNPQWQLVYTRMAVYGLRDHEAWLCEIDDRPPYACRVLDGKTGPRDGVLPLYPEWATAWQPWVGELPQVACHGDFSIYGDRTSKAFRRAQIPFAPYNLRHAWNIRGTVVFEIPIPVMAQMAGHSPEVHLRAYQKWISKKQSLQAYNKAIIATNRPNAPI